MYTFCPYDDAKLKEAKRLLLEVYEYYYGDPAWKRQVNRLETIIQKLEELENIKREERR